MFKSPASVAFNLFGYDIKFYGIMLFFAMLVGLFAVNFIVKKYYKNLDFDLLLDFFPWLIIVSVFCARLYYVLLNFDYYMAYKSEIFAFRQGGISIHGAILGGFIFAFIYFKFIKKKPLLPYVDVISYGLALGQSIGRWGNFFNQEAFGLPCNLPWKLYIEPAFRPLKYSSFEYFHPTFLYESIWDLFIFLILFFVIRKFAKNRAGLVFFTYLALYSFGRFFIESIRTDSALNLFSIPIAQIVSVIIFVVSIGFIVYLYKKPVSKA